MRGALFGAFLAFGMSAQAADVGGYFKESESKCGEWIASARHAKTPEHFYRIGLCYVNGWGVPQDRAAGQAWLRRAADGGHVQAKAALNSTKEKQ